MSINAGRPRPVAAGLLGLVLCVVWTLAGKALAFVVPQSPDVGAGSEWTYRSNLGVARVRMLERTPVEPGLEHYRWEMRIGGLRYAEALELTPTSLSATEREVGGFGLISQVFHYDTPELVLVASLEVGAKWEWRGRVRKGSESRDAAAFGEVLAHHPITVAAGQFDVFHIRIVREDGFGTRQYIDLWFDPNVGPIKAVGELQWTGLIGVLQRLVGLRRLEVELLEYSISSTSTPQQPRPSSI